MIITGVLVTLAVLAAVLAGATIVRQASEIEDLKHDNASLLAELNAAIPENKIANQPMA